MAAFRDFLQGLLVRGEVILVDPPQLTPADRPFALELLTRVGDRLMLDLAGEPIAWQPTLALNAAIWFADVCWLMVDDQIEVPANLGSQLGVPKSAADHFAVDIVLRMAGTVERRLRSRQANDPLRLALVETLRAWPLSGVRCEIHDSPTGSLDLGGHRGLQLLYAERLIAQPRDGWIPTTGTLREVVEWVFSEQGRVMGGR